MKYLEYSYHIKKTVPESFSHLIDLMRLQKENNYFPKATITTNDLSPNQIGKQYYVATNHGDIVVICTMELLKIVENAQVTFEYTYQILEKGKPTENGSSFLPWRAMYCITGFEEEKGGTRITTLMYASGVDTFFKTCLTRLLALLNGFQQRKAVKKLAESINIDT